MTGYEFDINDVTSFRVEDVTTAGKSNAWNQFAHVYTRQNADSLILIDADILFGEEDTLVKMPEMLENSPAADVSVAPLERYRFESAQESCRPPLLAGF